MSYRYMVKKVPNYSLISDEERFTEEVYGTRKDANDRCKQLNSNPKKRATYTVKRVIYND